MHHATESGTQSVRYTPVIPMVSLEKPTREALVAEAARLGDRYSQPSVILADLLADAEEALGGREDLPELTKRGYKVSEGLFARIELLTNLLKPFSAQQTRNAEAGKATTADVETTRTRLLAIRAELASIGKAAGLPAAYFSLETSHTERFNVVMLHMEDVLTNTAAVHHLLPDTQRVDALCTEARKLIDRTKMAWREAKLMRADRTLDTEQASRFERMLLDALMYVSAQGLAAYPNDEKRQARYRLDQVYGPRPTRAGAVTSPTPPAPAPTA